MEESRHQMTDSQARIASALHELARGRGIYRPDLIDRLGKGLDVLRRKWWLGHPTNSDVDAVRDAIVVQLIQLIRRLESSMKRKEPEQYKDVVGACFNLLKVREFRGMNLHARMTTMEENWGVSVSTSQRYLREAIDQMAEILASSDYKPTITETTGSPGLGRTAAKLATPHVANFLARLLSLSGAVQQALDAARESCMRQARAFYTFDLLLAILDLPGSRVAACFDELGQDWTIKTRDNLLAMPDPSKHPDPFMSFDWPQRDDVRRAWQYALEDGLPDINELQLLLAVMDSTTSETNVWLRRFLGEDYGQLRATAQRMRRDSPPQIKSPTPD